MKIVVLDAATLGEDLDLSPLSELGETIVYDATPHELTAERVADCDVVILNKIKLNAGNLSSAKNLKLICITATGFDNVALEDCRKLGIAVCNVSGYSTHSVAQTTLSLVLSLAMHLPYYDRYVKSGQYNESGVHNCLSPVFYELRKKTWGIMGYGNIGRQVAKVAEALGCEVIAYTKSQREDVRCVGLEELLEKSDVITIHLPLSAETKGIIGQAELVKMKKSVILVNAARGAVTDEAAIAKAVEQGEIAAFGTDVYSLEPIAKDNPLTRLSGRDNVVMTPHLAWGAYEARKRCLDEVILNIRDFYNGGTRNRLV